MADPTPDEIKQQAQAYGYKVDSSQATLPNAKPGPYTTSISAQDEPKFQSWVKQNKIPFEDDGPSSDYDMRGYWKDIGSKPGWTHAPGEHFVDTYKTPYHETFSNQSKYALPTAPHWEGDKLIDNKGSLVKDETPGVPTKEEVMQQAQAHGYKVQKPQQGFVSNVGKGFEDFGRGIGRAATGAADLMTHIAMPQEYKQATGMRPAAQDIFNQTVGPPNFPQPQFNLNDPNTFWPRPVTAGSMGAAMLGPAAGKMIPGLTGIPGVLANYSLPGAATAIGYGAAEKAAQGQQATPGELAIDAAAGTIMGTAFKPLEMAGQAIVNKAADSFAPKAAEKINLDAVAPAEPAAPTAPAAAQGSSFLNKRFKSQGPQPTEPVGEANLGDQSPESLKGTVRQQAVKLRQRTGSLNERLHDVVDKKLRLDQIEHYLESAYDVLAQRIRNRNKVNINRSKPVVIDPIDRKQAREVATEIAGLEKHQVKAKDRNYIDVIRNAGTALAKWNPTNKIMSNKQLSAEVGKYVLLQKAAKRAYEDAKTIAKLGDAIQLKSHVEVNYKGHKFTVSHVANRGKYMPHGTPEQNAIFYHEYTTLLKEMRIIQEEINNEFEPEIRKLIAFLEHEDPKMAKAIKGVQALKTADVTAAIERAGLTNVYRNVLAGLLSNDNKILQAFGAASIVAGQAMGGPAEAATDEKEQERNAINVGGALTLLGTAAILGPKVASSTAGKQIRSLTAHALHYISDKYYVPALKAAEAAAASLGVKTTTPEVANTVNRLIGAVFLSRSNMDIIERNADPTFLKAFQTAKLAYRKAAGGKDLFPPNATVEQGQTALKALYATSAAEIESLPLTPNQKKIFVQMFYAKKRVADICRAEEKRLSPSRNPAKAQDGGLYGNKALAGTIRLEREMNWEAGSPYQRSAASDAINLVAHTTTDMFQLGNFPMHGYHWFEGQGAHGARFGIETLRADALIYSRNPNALAFCRANNVTMPLVGQVVDTETPITGKIAMWQETVLKKVLGEGTYSRIINFKPGQYIRRLGSGKGLESLKTDTALVVGSEKAAGVLDYPGGGHNLRADITHWLNREPEKCSSHFSEEKGYAALGIIYDDVLDHCIGADAIGLRVNLTIDRWAQGTGGATKIVMPFVRTAAIANRARYLLAQGFIDAMASGDLAKAGAALGAFFMTYGISSAWQGHAAMEKEFEQYMMDNHPLELVKLHTAMARFNIVGQVPGAAGYVLNKAGIKNEFEKNNFVLTHTQPTFWWTSRLTNPIPLETAKAIVDIGDAAEPERTRRRDATFLAGQIGIGSIAGTISLAEGFKLMTAYIDSRDQGGHIDWSYSPHWIFNADQMIKDDHESWGGMEKSHFLNSHLEQQGNPVAASLTTFFRPGESIASEEKIFNDQVEYSCQRLLKRQFPDKTLDYFTEKLEGSRPVKQYYDHIYKKMSLHTATPQEIAMYGDVKTRLLALEQEENQPIIHLFDKMVKPKEYWQVAYKACENHPEAAKQLQPDPKWAKAHHRPYVQ